MSLKEQTQVAIISQEAILSRINLEKYDIMAFVTFAPDTGSFGSPGYQVPVFIPVEPKNKDPVKILPVQLQPEPQPETLQERNKRWGRDIQNYLNKDDYYKESHERTYTLATTQLVNENIFLVVSIAQGYRGKGLSLNDLIGEGNLGLMRAAEDYDPAFEFSTYATYWIRQSIQRALQRETRANLPIPYYICQSRKRIDNIESVLEKELKRKPEDYEIAARFNRTYYPEGPNSRHISEYHIAGLRIARKNTKSLRKRSLEGDEFQTSLKDKNTDPQDAVCLKEEINRAIISYKKLDKSEISVLEMHYGLEGISPMNFRQIGDFLGYTRANISKIHKNALRKLRADICPETESNVGVEIEEAA